MRCCLAVAIVLCAATARAQEPRPSLPGIVAPPASTSGHSFGIDWAALAGHDEHLTPDHQATSEPRRAVSGGWGSADLAARYAYQSRRWNFNVNGTGRERLYANVADLSTFDGAVDATLSGRIGRATSFSLRQVAQFQPFYQFTLITNLATPDATPLVPANDSLIVSKSRALTGALGIAHQLSRRASIAADYGFRQVEFVDRDGASRFELANARFTRAIGARNAMRLGYGYGRSSGNLILTEVTNEAPIVPTASTMQNVDFGMVYTRPLSPTRRMSVSLTSGPSVVSDRGLTQYRLLVDVAMSRDLTRRWSGHLDYHRGLTYLDGFADASYADLVRARLTGLARKRLHVELMAGYSSGQLGLTQSSGAYETYSGSADLRLGLSGNLSLVARYDYNQYFFDETVLRPPGIDRSMRRQSIRFGLRGWLPVF